MSCYFYIAITFNTLFLWPFDNPAVNRNAFWRDDGSALRTLEGLVLHDDV